jgi:hypothetical protein
MPSMPPPSRRMISSAKRCATVRAISWLASSLYCLPSTCGLAAVAGVVEPAVDNQPPVVDRKRAEGHHRRVGRSRRPLRQVESLAASRAWPAGSGSWRPGRRCPRCPDRCRAWRRRPPSARGLRIAAQRLEVRRGDANAVIAQVRAGMNPVLRLAGTPAKIARTVIKKGNNRECAFMQYAILPWEKWGPSLRNEARPQFHSTTRPGIHCEI